MRKTQSSQSLSTSPIWPYTCLNLLYPCPLSFLQINQKCKTLCIRRKWKMKASHSSTATNSVDARASSRTSIPQSPPISSWTWPVVISFLSGGQIGGNDSLDGIFQARSRDRVCSLRAQSSRYHPQSIFWQECNSHTKKPDAMSTGYSLTKRTI